MNGGGTGRSTLLILLPVVAALSLAAPDVSAERLGFSVQQQRFYSRVKSLHELRWDKLTRQGWDISCGAAALSTLLTYHNDRPFSEMAITLTLLKNGDPELVRARGGFSLLDLKRFVNAIGLHGLGYGDMTLEDLDSFAIPAIVPIRMRDFDHFVIFRQHLGERVMLGDPAFGNVTMPAADFKRIWKSRIAFYAVSEIEKRQLLENGAARGPSALTPDTLQLAIPDMNYAPRLVGRIPIVPVTRRPQLLAP